MLHCPSCGYQRRNDGAFLNISLELNFPINPADHPMVDSNGFSIASEKLELRDLLESHMQSETLDADNRWECSGCSNRVQAVKYNEYTSLPPSLMIHLNRLRYNTVSYKRGLYCI